MSTQTTQTIQTIIKSVSEQTTTTVYKIPNLDLNSFVGLFFGLIILAVIVGKIQKRRSELSMWER